MFLRGWGIERPTQKVLILVLVLSPTVCVWVKRKHFSTIYVPFEWGMGWDRFTAPLVFIPAWLSTTKKKRVENMFLLNEIEFGFIHTHRENRGLDLDQLQAIEAIVISAGYGKEDERNLACGYGNTICSRCIL